MMYDLISYTTYYLKRFREYSIFMAWKIKSIHQHKYVEYHLGSFFIYFKAIVKSLNEKDLPS